MAIKLLRALTKQEIDPVRARKVCYYTTSTVHVDPG